MVGPEGEEEIKMQSTAEWLQGYYDKLQAFLFEYYEHEDSKRLALIEQVLAEAKVDFQKHKRHLVLHENPLYQRQRPFNPRVFAYNWSHCYPVRDDSTPDGY